MDTPFATGRYLILLRWILTRANIPEFFIFQCCLLNQMCCFNVEHWGYRRKFLCFGNWPYSKFNLTPFLYITLPYAGMTFISISIVLDFTIWVYLIENDKSNYRIYIYITYFWNPSRPYNHLKSISHKRICMQLCMQCTKCLTIYNSLHS